MREKRTLLLCRLYTTLPSKSSEAVPVPTWNSEYPASTLSNWNINKFMDRYLMLIGQHHKNMTLIDHMHYVSYSAV